MPERDVTLAKRQNPLLNGDTIAIDVPRLSITIERVAGVVVGGGPTPDGAASTRIFEGDVCRIGSHASNDVVVDDRTISRFHCRIAREGGTWRIVDTGSRNGTRIHGVRILSAELEGEVTLAIGESILHVRPAGQSPSVSVRATSAFGAILGKSAAMQRLFAMLERVAPSDIDVLIQGESGTGKELVASELVKRSLRAQGPLVVVDCGSISPALVESELFGHVRGAFTGAERDREGAFEAADGGTVFLDEVGELPLELQPKLLRAIEAREVRRVGQTKSRRVDVRVVAATHRDLEREVNRGRFRDDLYYRLAKVSVRVPPLRDRVEDIPLLVSTFVSILGSRASDRLFSPEVLEQMQRHDWPGNVRELRNYVERSVVLGDAPPPRASGVMPTVRPTLQAEGSSAHGSEPGGSTDEPRASVSGAPPSVDRSLPFRIAKERAVEAFERAYIGPLLEECGGNVSKASRTASMDRMYLHQLAHKYGFKTTRRG